MNPLVLVTGASSGIGRAYAELFSEKGYDLLLVGRSESALHELANKLSQRGCEVHYIATDLRQNENVYALYEATKSRPVDVLINNAGFGQYGFFTETDLQAELDMISVNITAVMTLTKLYLRDMVARNGGTVINVSSTAAFQPVPLMNVYGATKSFVLSFTQAIAAELEGTNVHAMVVCPGSTESDFHRRAGSERHPTDKTKLMTARAVAEATYRGMIRHKRMVVPGWKNRLIGQAPRLLPRYFLTKLAKKMYLARKHP